MNYQAEIIVPVSPRRAYKAIAEEMSNWWTDMSGKFLDLGDRAKTDFGGVSFWTFEAITLNEPVLIELRCCEANHIHEGFSPQIKEEWLNTVLKFAIHPIKDVTSISFTHEGLKKDLLCFEVCKAGWDRYFLEELKTYLTRKGI